MALKGPVHAGNTNEIILGSYTEAQRNALSGMDAGTIIYNTTDSQLNIYDGSWKLIAPGPDGSSGAPFETVAQAQSAGVTEGLYYFKNSNGTSQQLYYDNSDGGWILVSSNNASSSTFPGGQTRHNLAYTLHRNGTNGHLGTPSPNNDYIIGNWYSNFAFNRCRMIGFGINSTNGTYTWTSRGNYIDVQWNTTSRNTITSYSGNVTWYASYSNGNRPSNANYFSIDGIWSDYNNGGFNANPNQTTIGAVGTAGSSGDPSSGCYMGHGNSEGSFEGWYGSNHGQQDSQGYTTWLR